MSDPFSSNDPPRGLDGFVPRRLRDGTDYWFRELDRWQYFVQPRAGARSTPPLAVVKHDVAYNVPMPPPGLEGFRRYKENQSPYREYYARHYRGWIYMAYPDQKSQSVAELPPLAIVEREETMTPNGDPALDLGYVPITTQPLESYRTNDSELGQIAMGGVQPQSSTSEPAGLFDGWFANNLHIERPGWIGAMAVVVLLAALWSKRRRDPRDP